MVTRARDKERHLARAPIFAGWGGKDLERIAGLADVVGVREGAELVRQGATGREMFIILEGRAVVVRDGAPVATLVAGDYFGELSLVDGSPCNATVVADSAMEVLVLGRREFQRALDETPRMRDRLITGMAARLRRADARDHGETALP